MEKNNRIDYGNEPLITNVSNDLCDNPYYRRILWTGENLQVSLMSVPIGDEVGLERHPDNDQFIKIESGCAQILMGSSAENLNIQNRINGNYAVIVPAGIWHNIKNIGNMPLKLYTVYAPPHHSKGTVHETRAVANSSED